LRPSRMAFTIGPLNRIGFSRVAVAVIVTCSHETRLGGI
jgi:hypothetical protein